MTTPPADELGYAAAIAELQAIIEDLESDDVDVDVIAAKVQRAAELIRTCRSRIETAEIEVGRIIAELDDAGPPDRA